MSTSTKCGAIPPVFPPYDIDPHHPWSAPKLECHSRHEPLAADEVQEGARGRVLVRVTAVRSRLIDEDNLCEKYHVDLCRYAGALASDEPGKTQIKVTQRKAGKGEAEHVVIEIIDSE